MWFVLRYALCPIWWGSAAVGQPSTTDAVMGMNNVLTLQLYIAFEGQVALCDNEQSWVAKWLRIDGFQSGM